MDTTSASQTRKRQSRAQPRPVKPLLRLLKSWASIIGVPYTTLRDRAKTGDFKVVRIGKREYAAEKEMLQWLERNTTTGA